VRNAFRGKWLDLVAAAVVLHLVLIQPNHPAATSLAVLFLFPLELPAILLGLVAIGNGMAGRTVRFALVGALAAIATLKAADYAMFTALGRSFNPVGDISLIAASFRLLSGTIGAAGAILAGAGAILTVAAVVALLWWATGVWARLSPPKLGRSFAAAGAVAAAFVAAAEIGDAMGRWTLPIQPPGAAFTTRVGVERVDMARATIADLREFAAAAEIDPFAGTTGLLDAIDRDVLIVFVESYGRTSIDTPFYAEAHVPTLEAAEARLSKIGLAMRSAYLSAPTRGGQSWLSHSTFASGLWVDDQTRYSAALASGRETLFQIAARSGFRTAAVMPAITLEWPEAKFMGFDTVLAAADLGYRGKPFNWVTMPDQFTLAALDRLLRREQDDRSLFAQVALISSHAPWVPVPEILDWERLGDGRVFDAAATSGDPPEVVWRDRDRVRAQYRLAIDYALTTVFDYAARHAETPPLMIIVGDHQAAGFIALDERSDVPIHVVGPAHLVQRIRGEGWSDGLIPEPDAAVVPMDRMRDMILRSFSTGAKVVATG